MATYMYITMILYKSYLAENEIDAMLLYPAFLRFMISSLSSAAGVKIRVQFMPEMGKGPVGRWGRNFGHFYGGGSKPFYGGGMVGGKKFF